MVSEHGNLFETRLSQVRWDWADRAQGPKARDLYTLPRMWEVRADRGRGRDRKYPPRVSLCLRLWTRRVVRLPRGVDCPASAPMLVGEVVAASLIEIAIGRVLHFSSGPVGGHVGVLDCSPARGRSRREPSKGRWKRQCINRLCSSRRICTKRASRSRVDHAARKATLSSSCLKLVTLIKRPPAYRYRAAAAIDFRLSVIRVFETPSWVK